MIITKSAKLTKDLKIPLDFKGFYTNLHDNFVLEGLSQNFLAKRLATKTSASYH